MRSISYLYGRKAYLKVVVALTHGLSGMILRSRGKLTEN